MVYSMCKLFSNVKTKFEKVASINCIFGKGVKVYLLVSFQISPFDIAKTSCIFKQCTRSYNLVNLKFFSVQLEKNILYLNHMIF